MNRQLRLVPSSDGQRPDERPWQDRWLEFRCWLAGNTVDRSPLVVVRRTTIEKREMNAFELGLGAAIVRGL